MSWILVEQISTVMVGNSQVQVCVSGPFAIQHLKHVARFHVDAGPTPIIEVLGYRAITRVIGADINVKANMIGGKQSVENYVFMILSVGNHCRASQSAF